jgi:hypothetical protein
VTLVQKDGKTYYVFPDAANNQAYAMGRASDLHAGALLPRSRPGAVAEKPELKDIEPFQTVLSGDHEAIAKLTLPELEKILFAALTGITADEFQAKVKKWIATAKHPRWKETILLAIVVKFCQRISGAGFRPFMKTNFRIGLPSHVTR